MNGKLYVVATPIGNLEDITLRAIRILQEVDFIAAEDTRHTLKLLNHLKINKPLISYYKEIENNKSDVLMEKLKQGKSIALVSDAGTPGISDPGEVIIQKAIREEIEIIPIPGPCALVNALIVSGLSTKEFTFVGFLPVNKKEKEEKLQELAYQKQTLIFYEAPHKLQVTLQTLQNILGDRNMVLVKELTKIHEEVLRGKISEVLLELQEIKGEYVILIEGASISKIEKEQEEFNRLSWEEQYQYYKEMGMEKKEIIKKIAKNQHKSKNEIYQYFLQKENHEK